MKPVSYLQTDSRWAGNDYSAKGEKTNIGRSGCGIACSAMVIASLADPSVTPADTAKWSLAHGGKALNQGTYYSYFEPQMAAYGISCKQVNFSTVYHGANSATSFNKKMTDSVKSGNWIICAMGKGDWTSSGHFVLWYGVEGDYALINDPNSTKASRTKAKLSTFQNQVKYYFEVKVEKTEEKPASGIETNGGLYVIDASEHNGSVDWSQVEVDGAIIRSGYRGYGQGVLKTDKEFNANVQGCVKNNIPFGVYWFTTAITEKEAVEEAEYVLSLVKGLKLWFPIFIDTEYSNDKKDGRSDKLSKANRTKCLKAFCDRIQYDGHIAGIYASESWLKEMIDVSQLPYRYWIANISKRPTYHDYDGWQKSWKGSVNGVKGNVDVSEWLSEREIYDPEIGFAMSESAYIQYTSKGETVMPDTNAYQPEEWSKEAREWAVESGIIKGDENGIKWDETVSLERMITIIHRIMKYEV